MRLPRQKRVQQSISWYSAPVWEELEEGQEHSVIIAGTAEQEPAELSHAAFRRKEKNLFVNSHLFIKLAAGSQRGLCVEHTSHRPKDSSRQSYHMPTQPERPGRRSNSVGVGIRRYQQECTPRSGIISTS